MASTTVEKVVIRLNGGSLDIFRQEKATKTGLSREGILPKKHSMRHPADIGASLFVNPGPRCPFRANIL